MYNTSLAENQDACLVKNLGLEIPESLLTDSPLVRLTRIPLSLKPLKIVVKTSKKFSKIGRASLELTPVAQVASRFPWKKQEANKTVVTWQLWISFVEQ